MIKDGVDDVGKKRHILPFRATYTQYNSRHLSSTCRRTYVPPLFAFSPRSHASFKTRHRYSKPNSAPVHRSLRSVQKTPEESQTMRLHAGLQSVSRQALGRQMVVARPLTWDEKGIAVGKIGACKPPCGWWCGNSSIIAETFCSRWALAHKKMSGGLVYCPSSSRSDRGRPDSECSRRLQRAHRTSHVAHC